MNKDIKLTDDIQKIKYVYEIIDCSNEDMFYQMGIYLDLKEAIEELEQVEYDYAFYPEEYVRMEVRRRKLGYSMDNYKMVYRAVWEERENKETGVWEMTRINL